MAQRAVSTDWGLDGSGQASGSTGVESSILTRSQMRRQRLLASVSERFMSSLAHSGHKSMTGQVSLLDASGYTIADTGYLRGYF